MVNPSSMPKRSGDRIKTDRRDGDAWRGCIGPASSPQFTSRPATTKRSAILVRAREDAVGLGTQAKHRLKAFLLRQGRRYPGRSGWTHAVSTLAGGSQFSVGAAAHRAAGVPRHDRRNRTPRRAPDGPTPAARRPAWRWAPVVDALQALRGVSFVTAVGARRGSRRHPTLRPSARTDGVSRPRAVGTLEWAQCPTRRDHQGRQSARAAVARRSGVGVSGRSADRTPACCTDKKRCPRSFVTSRGRPNSG